MGRSPLLCVAVLISCLTLAHTARLTEQPIDLLPTPEYDLQGVQEPRHISGYFQVRSAVTQGLSDDTAVLTYRV